MKLSAVSCYKLFSHFHTATL